MDNNNIEPDNSQLGGIFLIIGWILVIGILGILIQKAFFSTKPPTINQTYAGTQITIYRDYDSHFRIAGSINDTPVTFLIDTGATSVAVPEDIASKAHLARAGTVSTSTANGTGTGYLTKIDKLTINQIEFQHISAVIIPSMDSDETLLGMNILSQFEIQQTENTLILTIPAKQTP